MVDFGSPGTVLRDNCNLSLVRAVNRPTEPKMYKVNSEMPVSLTSPFSVRITPKISKLKRL